MGYVSKDIAVITEPKRLTLAAVPNFITFASKPRTQTLYKFNIQVVVTATTPNAEVISELRVTEPSGVLHIFTGTTDANAVADATFNISDVPANTAENLRQALLNNLWIAANFEIHIPFVWTGDTPTNGAVINLESKGAGEDYNIDITAPNNSGNAAYILTPINIDSTNGDSISGEASTAEIEIDVYTDPGVPLGQVDNTKLGTFAVALQKTYAGVPVWFELNSIFQHYAGYAVPPDAPGWFNTGTMRGYRFVAKVKGADSYAFYVSSALYVVNGYGPASDPVNLEDYAYGNGIFKPLTNRPRTVYVRGQKEYFNFIFSDPGAAPTMLIAYGVYTASDQYVTTVYKHAVTRAGLSMINTCVLDIDAVLAEYPNAGIIRVSLVNGDLPLTEEVEYEILPDCLHKVTQFVFLNRLGGWDAFNFDASTDDETKPQVETYNKTLTPAYTKSTGIESVYTTNLDNTLTVKGAPVSNEVAYWLKELAAARVVLDGNGNYVVIDDFTLKISDDTANTQVPTIKYHISETFTND